MMGRRYLNGTVDSTRTTDGAPIFNNGTLVVGKEGSFDGPRSFVHAVTIIHKRLTPELVATEFAAGKGTLVGLCPGLCPAATGQIDPVTAASLPLSHAMARFELGKALLAAPKEPKTVEIAESLSGHEGAHSSASIALPQQSDAPIATGTVTPDPPPRLRDAVRALEQFERAGYPAALLEAAKLRLFGDDGVAVNPARAHVLLTQVWQSWSTRAVVGSATDPTVVTTAAEAARWLAVMAAAGMGQPRDENLAVLYFRLAAAGGDPFSQVCMDYASF
jgi:hypothetical protein